MTQLKKGGVKKKKLAILLAVLLSLSAVSSFGCAKSYDSLTEISRF